MKPKSQESSTVTTTKRAAPKLFEWFKIHMMKFKFKFHFKNLWWKSFGKIVFMIPYPTIKKSLENSNASFITLTELYCQCWPYCFYNHQFNLKNLVNKIVFISLSRVKKYFDRIVLVFVLSIIHDIHGRKKLHMIYKDLLSQVERKQEFDQRNRVFRNYRFLLDYFWWKSSSKISRWQCLMWRHYWNRLSLTLLFFLPPSQLVKNRVFYIFKHVWSRISSVMNIMNWGMNRVTGLYVTNDV